MNLTEKPEVVAWPEMNVVFVEKVGPFQTTARQAWEELARLKPAIVAQTTITRNLALYNVESSVYRGCVAVAAMPPQLAAGLKSEIFKGGKYAGFTLKGPWSELGAASGRVFELVKELKLQRRDGFCIEHYVNDSSTVAEDQLVTEILIPIA